METHDSYIGLKPFGVLIDQSPELEALVSRARKLKGQPFEEKLRALKEIAVNAMVNAYEQWQANPDESQRKFFGDVVMNTHPLSYALRNRAGCCRYQGALFFALGHEADLGDVHFIQQAPVDPVNLEYGDMRSVFNDIIHDRRMRHVSIFQESLQDKSFDYSVKNPRIFESAIGFGWPKGNPCARTDPWRMTHYSYHRTGSGLVIVSEKSRHVTKLPEQLD